MADVSELKYLRDGLPTRAIPRKAWHGPRTFGFAEVEEGPGTEYISLLGCRCKTSITAKSIASQYSEPIVNYFIPYILTSDKNGINRTGKTSRPV